MSTSVIADRLGVSQGLLFQRFGSKDELMRAALMPPAVAPWVERLAGGPDGRAIPDQLREIALEATEFFDELVPCTSVLRAAGQHPHDMFERYDTPPPLAALAGLSDWLKRARRRGRIRKCDTEGVAMTLLGALHIQPFINHIVGHAADPERDCGGPCREGRTPGWAHEPRLGREAYIESLVDLVWRGVAPEEP